MVIGTSKFPTSIGRRSVFGHRCMIIAATVGDLCEIGNTSVLMTGKASRESRIPRGGHSRSGRHRRCERSGSGGTPEHDLHDGTQQRLVALGLAVRAIEADAPGDLANLHDELSRIAAGLVEATAELQEISRGIHPANLSQSGLGAALRTLARRSPIPVDLEITIEGRLPESVEVAAYYVTSEALANTAKHAQATRVEVSLTSRDNAAFLSIRDDGIGGADPARGSGLVGLVDRVQALGGTIDIQSTRGEGTCITTMLPLDAEASTDRDDLPSQVQ